LRKKSPVLLAKILEVRNGNGNGLTSYREIAKQLNINHKTVANYLNTPEVRKANEDLYGKLLGNVGLASDIINRALESQIKEPPQDADAKVYAEYLRAKRAQSEVALQVLKTLGKEHMSNAPKTVTTEQVMLTAEDRSKVEEELKQFLLEDVNKNKEEN